MRIEGFGQRNLEAESLNLIERDNEVSTNRLLAHDLRRAERNAEMTSTDRSARHKASSRTRQSDGRSHKSDVQTQSRETSQRQQVQKLVRNIRESKQSREQHICYSSRSRSGQKQISNRKPALTYRERSLKKNSENKQGVLTERDGNQISAFAVAVKENLQT